MNDETLLDKAYANLELYIMIIKYLSGDDLQLNFAAYHLQQALELGIKHKLELSGVKYPPTHDITDLLDLCAYDVDSDLYTYSATITKWESKTRYVKGYRLALRQLEKGESLIRKYLLEISPANMHIKLYRRISGCIPEASRSTYGKTEEQQVINFYHMNRGLFDNE
jgi:HEPN domain-containing protein